MFLIINCFEYLEHCCSLEETKTNKLFYCSVLQSQDYPIYSRNFSKYIEIIFASITY